MSNHTNTNKEQSYAQTNTENIQPVGNEKLAAAMDVYLKELGSGLPKVELADGIKGSIISSFANLIIWFLEISEKKNYHLRIQHGNLLGTLFFTLNQTFGRLFGFELKIDLDIDYSEAIKQSGRKEPFPKSMTQEIVGLAAMASQAAYNIDLDQESFPPKSNSKTGNKKTLFEQFNESFWEALITMPNGAYMGKMPTDEKEIYAWFNRHHFKTNTLVTSGKGLVLLVEGESEFLKTENKAKQKYYIIAVRGTIMPQKPVVWPVRDWIEYWVAKVASLMPIEFNPVDVANCLFACGASLQINEDNFLPERNVHAGFYGKSFKLFSKLTKEVLFIDKGGKQTYLVDILKQVQNDANTHLIITGHSQGAANALALTALMRLAVKNEYAEFKGQGLKLEKLQRMELVTFAQPSLGNKTFKQACKNELHIGDETRDHEYIRIIREGDLVTIVPGEVWGKADPAVHFGKIEFQETGLNPITYVKNGKYEEMIKKLFEAHNSGAYLAWVYNLLSEDFVKYWEKQN